VDRHRAPMRRIEAFVRGLFGFLADSSGDLAYMALLAAEHQRRARQRPAAVAAAVAPFVDLLAAELRAAHDAGLVRDGPPARDAATVFQLVLSQLHPLVLGHSLDDPAETAAYLWRFVRAAITPAKEVTS
ncbi:MAG: hypothetical protein K1X95_16685, partial [Acidimicrobiia bacterium]|nr:hypothetical protein [Acidimicrobiia bacterium]